MLLITKQTAAGGVQAWTVPPQNCALHHCYFLTLRKARGFAHRQPPCNDFLCGLASADGEGAPVRALPKALATCAAAAYGLTLAPAADHFNWEITP